MWTVQATLASRENTRQWEAARGWQTADGSGWQQRLTAERVRTNREVVLERAGVAGSDGLHRQTEYGTGVALSICPPALSIVANALSLVARPWHRPWNAVALATSLTGAEAAATHHGTASVHLSSASLECALCIVRPVWPAERCHLARTTRVMTSSSSAAHPLRPPHQPRLPHALPLPPPTRCPSPAPPLTSPCPAKK